MSILKAKNLTKKFDSFTAVDRVSFELYEGEILGLLGPNGAGKTTAIQMLLGVLTPTAGTVSYFGKELHKNRTEIMERVNFSSAYTNLPWRLTVSENLTFISHLYRISDKRRRVGKIMKTFRLQDLANKEMNELSAGQITRVNLAKAFLNFPKVLLLDEPTASLDPETASYIRGFLRDQQKSFGVSMIFTSHNMYEVEEMCDRVVFIHEGRVIADDTPHKLAKTIRINHIELLIKDGLKRTIAICKAKKLPYSLKGRFIVIDIKDRAIPYFLKDLLERGIEYDEISIEKPTLEDYFLERASQKK